MVSGLSKRSTGYYFRPSQAHRMDRVPHLSRTCSTPLETVLRVTLFPTASVVENLNEAGRTTHLLNFDR